jgi:polyhydroxybutyrate depolymerase
MSFHGTADPVVPYGGGTVNSPAALGHEAPPVDAAVKDWAARDGCAPEPKEQRTGASTRHLTFGDCDPGMDVEQYVLGGGGHTWPGGLDVQKLGITQYGATVTDVPASDLMVDFFTKHAKND